MIFLPYKKCLNDLNNHDSVLTHLKSVILEYEVKWALRSITRGSGWRGRWEGGSEWGTHVNPWLFHFNV